MTVNNGAISDSPKLEGANPTSERIFSMSHFQVSYQEGGGRRGRKQLVNLKCVWNGLSNLFGFIKSHYKHYNIITSEASVPGH